MYELDFLEYYPVEFIKELLQHYQQRLIEARTVEERSFLRGEVYRWKTLLKNS